MGVVEHTGRKPSFMSDVKKYGSGGEGLFVFLEEDKMKKKGYNLFNVADNHDYQLNDVDFVVAKDSKITSLPTTEEVLTNDVFDKVEVKIDTRALETGNLPYEFVSHGKQGWSFITKADHIYMILCEENGSELVAKKIMWIDMHKWHEFVRVYRPENKLNHIKNEVIIDMLCRINDMINNGVIISVRDINIHL